MTIWVGQDGTLNDDDGDGPAVAGDPMEPLVGFHGYPGVYPGRFPGYFGHGYPGYYEMPYEYVGEDDWGSALGSIGSAIGSAFGGSGSGGGAGGGAGGGGGGGFDFGSLASSFGSALGSGQGGGGGGGSGDTGAAIANIFGQVAKVAVPAATQAIARSQQSHPQPQSPAATPAQQRTTAPAQRSAQARQKHAIDPKAKLNLTLAHLGKQYGLTPPSASGSTGSGSDKTALSDVGSFVQNMMGGPKSNAGASAATGEFVGDISFGIPRIPFGFGINIAPTYPAYSIPRRSRHYADQGYQQTYPYYSDQGYAQQAPYAQPQSRSPVMYQPYPMSQPQQITATRSPVTYQPYPMPQLQKPDAAPKKWSAWAMEVGPMTVTHPDAPKMVQVSATAPRNKGVGKFVSKMMGGPGAHPMMKSDEILRDMQRTLNRYYATRVLAEDGIMGDETHRILKWFQKSNSLPETGNPDFSTKAMLDKLLEDRAVGQGLQPSGTAQGSPEDGWSDWMRRMGGDEATGWMGWGWS